jgi:hypothetical protein
MAEFDERISVLILEADHCRTVKVESLRNAVLWGLLGCLALAIFIFSWALPAADLSRRRSSGSIVALILCGGAMARNINRHCRAKRDLAVYENALRMDDVPFTGTGSIPEEDECRQ